MNAETIRIMREVFLQASPRSKVARRIRSAILSLMFWPLFLYWLFNLYTDDQRFRNAPPFPLAMQARIMANVTRTLCVYYELHGSLPQSPDALDVGGGGRSQLDSFIERDWWGRRHHVTLSETNVGVRIMSYGRDGTTGGSGMDADWVYALSFHDSNTWLVCILSCPVPDVASAELDRRLTGIPRPNISPASAAYRIMFSDASGAERGSYRDTWTNAVGRKPD